MSVHPTSFSLSYIEKIVQILVKGEQDQRSNNLIPTISFLG